MPRFFSPTSFWNQPIGPNPRVDPESAALLEFMHQSDARGFWLNLVHWTIPIYEVDATTPRRKVYRRFEQMPGHAHLLRSKPYLTADHPLGHGPGFAQDAAAGLIPIPDYAAPDPKGDAHMAIVDWDSAWIWDMHAARRRPDGDWESREGMKCRADGTGVFDRDSFAVHNGESIHPYGPSRAAGVPALAGTILHDENPRHHEPHLRNASDQPSTSCCAATRSRGSTHLSRSCFCRIPRRARSDSTLSVVSIR